MIIQKKSFLFLYNAEIEFVYTMVYRFTIGIITKIGIMQITFSIPFGTIPGEKILIIGSLPELGSWIAPVEMQYSNQELWELTIITSDTSAVIEYRYLLLNAQGKLKHEFGNRIIYASECHDKVLVKDWWRDQNTPSNPLFTSAFSRAIYKHDAVDTRDKQSKHNLIINIREPRVGQGNRVALTGACKAFGEWDDAHKVLFSGSDAPMWTAEFVVDDGFDTALDYKYAIYDDTRGQIEQWEQGSDRHVKIDVAKDTTTIINDEGVRFKNDWRGAGVAVPVFSLRSNRSFGIGEFTDLHQVADWCKKCSLQMIQVLPVNDTISSRTWEDSYPYNAISVEALNPAYINLQSLPGFKIDDDFLAEQVLLNREEVIDFEKVLKAKEGYLCDWFKRQKKMLLTDKNIVSFLDENAEWLKPYVVFCVLRDTNETAYFPHWEDFSEYSEAVVERFFAVDSAYHSKVYFYVTLQYFLHKQLKTASNYAREKGVVLKGDIPIGISSSSVEAWSKPELFNLKMQTGAPPDDFSAMGQNWGFPTYNWDVMANDNFKWWRNRLTHFSHYFDAYRIDHILGFFRIWQIPVEQSYGLLGYFNPALPLTDDEIESFGISFSRDRMVKPFIKDFFLKRLFGAYADRVKDTYLDTIEEERYLLKPEFETQRKIEAHFGRLAHSSENELLRDGLMCLVAEVLFIEDPVKKKHYHPRINFDRTFSFRALPVDTQERLWQLHNDFFFKRHDDFWKNEAMKKLPSLVSATDMLVCGEDLGMIPENVPEVMDELGILSLEIQRMPKEFGTELGNPAHYPYWSVASPSSHDTSNIRAFWEENYRLSEKLYHHNLKQQGKAPLKADEEIIEAIIDEQLGANSMWTILPLQDWMALKNRYWFDDPQQERINKPEFSRHHWRFRMKGNIETLIRDNELNEEVSWLVKKHHRLVR